MLFTTPMSLCSICGLTLGDATAICPHHHASSRDDWAVGNRLICDFLHRRKVLDRLPAQYRRDDFWAYSGEAG